MALAPDDPALIKDPNDPNNQQAAQGAQGLGGQGAVQNTGGSGQDPFAGGSGVSTAGVGSGGTGGWTNIQAYLNANQGNTGSSDALNKQVGGAFDQEDQAFKDQSSQAKTQAQGEVDRSNLGQDQASKLVQDAAGMYQYGNKPQHGAESGQDPYKAIIDQFSNARKAYSGPSSFSYQSPTYSQAQDYGANLGNDQGFGGLMQGIYNKSAGGQINSGELSLQNQLDANSQPLQQARQNLLDRYAGLRGGIDQGSLDTNQFLNNAATQTGANQSGLDQYLGGMATSNKGQLDLRANVANSEMKDFSASLAPNLEKMINVPDSGRSKIDAVVNPATLADESNVMGADSQRNAWNVIQDILGRQEQKIGLSDKMYDANNAQFNISGLPEAGENGTKSLAQILSDPFLNGTTSGFGVGYGPIDASALGYFNPGPLDGYLGGMIPRRI